MASKRPSIALPAESANRIAAKEQPEKSVTAAKRVGTLQNGVKGETKLMLKAPAFAKSLLKSMETMGYTPEFVLRILGVTITEKDGTAKEQLLRMMSSGENMAAFVHLVCDRTKISVQLENIERELLKRRDLRESAINPELSLVFVLWGVAAEDFREPERSQLASLHSKSDIRPAIAMTKFIGAEKSVGPALRRLNEELKPRTLEQALTLIGRKDILPAPGSKKQLPPYSVLRTFFKENETPMPAAVAIDTQLEIAKQQREEGGPPFGAVLRQLLDRLGMEKGVQSLSPLLKRVEGGQALDDAQFNTLIRKCGILQYAAIHHYLSALRDSQDVPAAILATLKGTRSTVHCRGFDHLIAMYADEPGKQEELHEQIKHLLDRRDLLLRWQSGKLQGRQSIDSAWEKEALLAVEQIPGATLEDILGANSLLKARNARQAAEEVEEENVVSASPRSQKYTVVPPLYGPKIEQKYHPSLNSEVGKRRASYSSQKIVQRTLEKMEDAPMEPEKTIQSFAVKYEGLISKIRAFILLHGINDDSIAQAKQDALHGLQQILRAGGDDDDD